MFGSPRISGRVAPVGGRLGIGAALTSAILAMVLVSVFVDLTPNVESEFFFSKDDPQYRSSAELAQRFPTPQQILIRAAGNTTTLEYSETIERVTETLENVDGVSGVMSITNRDSAGPLYGRILLPATGSGATNLVVELDENLDIGLTIDRIEEAVTLHSTGLVTFQISGAPYAVQRIRKNLTRDLAVFSIAAIFLFGTITGVVYRAFFAVAGTLTVCVGAAATTLLVTRLLGGELGLLTANITTIVFVITLSHIVFLIANWRLARLPGSTHSDSVSTAIKTTIAPSLWCMVTTFLGFSSLLFASAKPLRELGLAGGIGTLCAFTWAYLAFPPFLRTHSAVRTKTTFHKWHRFLPATLSTKTALVFVVLAVLGAFGTMRLSTDPSLVHYFNDKDPIRDGLQAIDTDGGSSPLYVSVRDIQDRRIDSQEVLQSMERLVLALEADPDVGTVITPSLIVAEARTAPLIGLLPARNLLDILSVTSIGNTIKSFFSDDRQEGLIFLRMREIGRTDPRLSVQERILNEVTAHDFAVTGTGGLYQQQAQLGQLIGQSLRYGLGALVVLFFVVVLVASKSPRAAFATALSLAGVAFIILGTWGYAGVAVDLISSPATNVALAMGVDSMIHLMTAMRRSREHFENEEDRWLHAITTLRQPIASAAIIVSAGFGIFAFSTFPPTQRFGVGVIIGTLAAAATTLFVLPALTNMLPPWPRRTLTAL